MVQLNFNAQNHAPDAGGQDVLPTGTYLCQITASEIKATKRGDGHMLVLTAAVIDGEQAGKRLMIRLNIDNPNKQAVDIAYGQLSAISHCVGRLQWADSQEIHGIPFKIRVEQVARADDPTKAGNEIKGFEDQHGNPPSAAAATTAPAPAAPAAPAAQTTQAPAAVQAPDPAAAPATAPVQQAAQPVTQAPAQVAAPVQTTGQGTVAHPDAGNVAPPWAKPAG